MASAVVCYDCHKDVMDGDKWVRCTNCIRRANTKCVNSSGIKNDSIDKIEWSCIHCNAELKCLRKMNIVRYISDGFQKINEKIDENINPVKMKIE